ncbi:MAG TPA: DUF3800 domain-containing protein [Terriglobales bacterium]|nr:DUF3800 domain-containing protein [Terriglobales bacterium]
MMQPIEHLQSFADDSMSFLTDRIISLCALVHRKEKWDAFSDDWDKELATEPAIKYLHMREARPCEGQFKGWKPLQRDMKLIALTEVILRHNPHIVMCWFSSRDWDEKVGKIAPVDVRPAYIPCFLGIVTKVAEFHHEQGINIPTDYVFDEQNEVGKIALFWYDIIKAMAKPPVAALMGSTPVFRNDEDILPLQAADLVAWHMRRSKERRKLDPELAATERVEELTRAEVHMDGEKIADIARQMSELPGIESVQDGASAYKTIKRMVRKGKSGELMASKEYDNFNRTMRQLMTVSHAEMKAKLDAEKAAKRRKPKRTSASGRALGGDKA